MKTPRRAFLGALATAPWLPGGAVAGGAVAAGAEPPPSVSETGGMTEGLVLAARARFGHHLSPDEVSEVTKAIEYGLRSAAKLRSIPLANADEPVATFEARPRSPRGGGARR
jgi:hypothetical protein